MCGLYDFSSEYARFLLEKNIIATSLLVCAIVEVGNEQKSTKQQNDIFHNSLMVYEKHKHGFFNEAKEQGVDPIFYWSDLINHYGHFNHEDKELYIRLAIEYGLLRSNTKLWGGKDVTLIEPTAKLIFAIMKSAYLNQPNMPILTATPKTIIQKRPLNFL